MNLKRFCSFVLCICYLSLSAASLTWADTASDSNADYEVMTLAAAQASPLTANVNGSWITLNYGDSSQSWVTVPANCIQIAWASRPDSLGDYRILKLDPDGNDMRFSNCFVRLIDAQTIYVNDDFFSHLCDDGSYYFSAYSSVESTIHFDISSGAAFRLYLNSFFPTASNFQSVSVGGVYTSADKPFTMKTAKIDSRSVYPYSMIYHSGQWYNYYFPSGGILKKGYEYSFMFYAGNNKYGGMLRLVSDPIYLAVGVRSGNYMTFTFTPSRNIRTEELQFFIDKQTARVETVPFYYVSSSSTYIPVSDTGQQGQVTAANTTVIKNVVTNISNTVSNISNQITNTTNTITNTITNTTNQIKEAVSQSANQISQTVTNTSNQITDSVNQSAEKISQTVTNKVNEVNGTINSVGKETQKKIDDMQKAVVDKLEDTKTGIITGIIDGLKSLFIPSDDFFKTWFDDMYSFFDERLGFLMLPVDLLVNLIDMVVSADSSNAGIPFPEIQWEGTILIPAQTVKIEIFDTDFGKELQDKLYFVGNVIMIGALLSLMHRKIEEVLRS